MAPGDAHARGGPGYYPLSVDLCPRLVLIVGAGKRALREVSRLLEFGATVHVVAPVVLSELRTLGLTYGERLLIKQRSLSDEDLQLIKEHCYLLVFACSNNIDENMRAIRVASRAGVLFCDVDGPDESSFVVPALMKRGHLKVTVSTDGWSPILARVIQERLEAALGGEIDKFMLFAETLRENLVQLEADPQLGNRAARRRLMRRLAESEEIYRALRRQNFQEAKQLVESLIAQARESTSS